MSKSIAIVGANGGLGQALVRSFLSAGYLVRAVVRESSVEKTRELFPDLDVTNSNQENLSNAFNGIENVIEVVSNSIRPNGIQDYITAAEEANVQVFIACGGAFGLFINDEQTMRLIDVVDGKENFLAMNQMHLDVQQLAFKSRIPCVFQICPPYMPLSLSSYTGDYVPVLNKAAGVQQVGYEDVASCVVLAMNHSEAYNRGMMGIGRK